jgi:hypothetical protein
MPGNRFLVRRYGYDDYRAVEIKIIWTNQNWTVLRLSDFGLYSVPCQLAFYGGFHPVEERRDKTIKAIVTGMRRYQCI